MNVILDERFVALLEARLSDPFSLLGRHKEGALGLSVFFSPMPDRLLFFLEGAFGRR